MDKVADRLENLSSRLQQGVQNRILWEYHRIENLKQRVPNAVYKRINDAKYSLLSMRKDLQMVAQQYLSVRRHRLELLQQRLNDALPEKQLARGFSIALKNGKVVKDASCLQEGDTLITLFHQGKVESIIK